MNPEDSAAESDGEKESAESAFASAEPLQGTADTEPTQNNSDNPKSESYWEKRQFTVQKTIAYAGVIGIAIYTLQLCEMRKATTAATEGVRLARDTAQLEQRAWVAPFSIEGVPEVGKPFEITVTIKNTGRTFALDFHAVAAFLRKELADPPPDFDKELEIQRDTQNGFSERTGASGLLPPEGVTTNILKPSKDMKLDAAGFDLANSPTTVMYVFGRITYKDVFGCDHWTRYAAKYKPGGTYQTYGVYSDADNNRCLEGKP